MQLVPASGSDGASGTQRQSLWSKWSPRMQSTFWTQVGLGSGAVPATLGTHLQSRWSKWSPLTQSTFWMHWHRPETSLSQPEPQVSDDGQPIAGLWQASPLPPPGLRQSYRS